MSIKSHPEQGTIVICDFRGFVAPEMVKRRPAVVISPRLRKRGRLEIIIDSKDLNDKLRGTIK